MYVLHSLYNSQGFNGDGGSWPSQLLRTLIIAIRSPLLTATKMYPSSWNKYKRRSTLHSLVERSG